MVRLVAVARELPIRAIREILAAQPLGLAGFNIGLFIVMSLISRGMRFYFVAFPPNRCGTCARSSIEQRLGLWAALSAAGIVIGFIVVERVF